MTNLASKVATIKLGLINNEQFMISGVWQDLDNQSHGRCYKVYNNNLEYKVVFQDNPVCFAEYKEEFVAIKNEQVFTLQNVTLQVSDINLSEVTRLSENQFEAKLDLYNKRTQRRDFINAIDTLAGVECLKFINNPPN